MNLYRTLWRWHFYAGLCCIPFILALAVSGAIYLFKPQIDTWVERPYMNLPANGARQDANAHIQAALTAVPGATFVSYRLPESDRDAVVVSVSDAGKRTLVYIAPDSLEVMRVVGYDDQFIRMVNTFHGELLAGNPGSIIVELAGCWGIVLVLTGLYLWWPRSARGLAGVLYPRLGKGRRVFWRDLHAVSGIYISAFTLFLLVSGLPWALVWGTAFKEIRQWSNASQQQDWSLGRADEHRAMHDHEAGAAQSLDLSNPVMQSALALQLAPPVEMSIDRDNPGNWKISSQNQNRPLRSDAWINSANGEVVRIKPFSEKSGIDRAIGIGIAAHEGQLFGWPNQLLGLLTTLGLIAMSVSGLVLWWQRKPQGALGAPPAPPNQAVGKTVTATIILLAAVLPLLAMSLVFLFVLERLVLLHMSSFRQWLGLQNA